MLESLVVENAFRGVETIEGDVRIEGGNGWEIGSVDDESLISVIMKGGGPPLLRHVEFRQWES